MEILQQAPFKQKEAEWHLGTCLCTAGKREGHSNGEMPVTRSCQKMSSHSCFVWTHLLLHSVDTGGHLLYARGTRAPIKIPGLLVLIGR